jgi:hypothetical protein
MALSPSPYKKTQIVGYLKSQSWDYLDLSDSTYQKDKAHS